jgi:hypothetical protein
MANAFWNNTGTDCAEHISLNNGMKLIDLFPIRETCYIPHLTEANPRGTKKTQRGQSTSTAGDDTSGAGLGRSDAIPAATRPVGSRGTANRNAGDGQNDGTNSRLAQVDPVASKCRIEQSKHFEPSVASMAQSLGISQDELDNRIDLFIQNRKWM